MQTLRPDFAGCPVIIGGGLAGLMTALRLAPRPVILLAKVPLGRRSGLGLGPGRHRRRRGRGRPAGPARRRHLAAGDGLSDPAVAGRIAAAAPAAIIELERHGVRVRPRSGRPPGAWAWRRRTPAAASSMSRATARARAIMRALVAAVQATPSITVIEGLEARRLLVDDRGIAGVLAAGPSDACLLPSRRRRAGDRRARRALSPTPPTRWAPSARAWRWPRGPARRWPTWSSCSSTPPRSMSGSIPCRWSARPCAARARCWSTRPARASWQAQGRGELEPRDVVSRAVAAHIAAGHRVFLDARPALGADFASTFPRHHRALPGRRHRSRAPADPGAPGGALPHGRRRRGRRGPQHRRGPVGLRRGRGNRPARRQPAGQQLAARGGGHGGRGGRQHRRHRSRRRCRQHGRSLCRRRRTSTALRGPISETLGVVRDRAGLERAVGHLQPLAFKGGGAADPALVALMIATAALAREESRGGALARRLPAELARLGAPAGPARPRHVTWNNAPGSSAGPCRLPTVPQPLVAGA